MKRIDIPDLKSLTTPLTEPYLLILPISDVGEIKGEYECFHPNCAEIATTYVNVVYTPCPALVVCDEHAGEIVDRFGDTD